MNYQTNRIMVTATMFLLSMFSVYASPLTPVVKAGVKAAEQAGAHAGGKAVVRGGAAFAMATARHDAAKAATRTTVGTIAECATPGRILAVGGATALVVGAHETADGLQTVSESVGDAVRNNPEAARGLFSDFLAWPKSIIALIFIGGVVFLLWFLWPFIAFARAGIRLAIIRKSRIIAEDVPLSTVESGKSAIARNSTSGFTRIGVVWAVAGFIALTLLGVWRLARIREMQTPTATSTSTKCVNRSDERLRAEYKWNVDRIYQAFLAEVDSVANKGFGRTRANIPDIVEEFGSMSHCAALVKAMVSDRLFGGKRVDGIMQQDLAPFYDKLYTARDDVTACVRRLTENLVVANRAFAHKLGKELEVAEANGDEAYKAVLEQCAENVEKRICDLTSGQLVAGIAVAVEAVCIRETVATVAKLLGGIAARQAGTMAASAGAAAVDGPLPVGDIIGGVATVGCTLWSGWDVYQASKVLPAKLAETFRSATDECERQCREDARRIGEDLVSNFLRKNQDGSYSNILSIQTVGLCAVPSTNGCSCAFVNITKESNPILSASLISWWDGEMLSYEANALPFCMQDAEEDSIYPHAPFIGAGYGLGWHIWQGQGKWYRPLYWPWKRGVVQGHAEATLEAAEKTKAKQAAVKRLEALRAKWPNAEDWISMWDMPDCAKRFFEIDALQDWCNEDKKARYGEFEEACREAIAMKIEPPVWYYNLACALAVQGKRDEAFDALEQAVVAGYNKVEHAKCDSDFDTISDNPRFSELLQVMGLHGRSGWQWAKKQAAITNDVVELTADNVYFGFNKHCYLADVEADGTTLFYMDRDGKDDVSLDGYVTVKYEDEAKKRNRHIGLANIVINKNPVVARGTFVPEQIRTAAVDAIAVSQQNVLGLYACENWTNKLDWCILYRGGEKEGRRLAAIVRIVYLSLPHDQVAAMLSRGEFAREMTTRIHNIVKDGKDGAVIDVADIDVSNLMHQ